MPKPALFCVYLKHEHDKPSWWKCCSTFQMIYTTHNERATDRPTLFCVTTQHVCECFVLQLINNDLNPVDRSSDNSGIFFLFLNLFMDKFKSLNTGTTLLLLMQNTDQLSASLKTDKTGVWHWNSSQRIKGSILPPQSVTLHFHCESMRWLMLSAFKHRGATS